MRIEALVVAIVGLAIGAGVGGTVGYFISEKKFMRRLEEERSKWKASQPVVAGPAKKEEPEPEKKDEKLDPLAQEAKAAQEYRDRSSLYSDPQQNKEENRVNYSGYSQPEKKHNPVEDIAPVEKGDGPYRITFDQFHNTNIGEYEKKLITWFAGSHDLVDENDDTQLDPGETVGYENLASLVSEGTMWVRNDSLGEDYEVTFVDGCYTPLY